MSKESLNIPKGKPGKNDKNNNLKVECYGKIFIAYLAL
jgi:hypothetical protein